MLLQGGSSILSTRAFVLGMRISYFTVVVPVHAITTVVAAIKMLATADPHLLIPTIVFFYDSRGAVKNAELGRVMAKGTRVAAKTSLFHEVNSDLPRHERLHAPSA